MRLPSRLNLAVFVLIALQAKFVLAGPGELDRSYTPTILGNGVYAMGVQVNGELVVGGSFISVDGSSSRAYLA